MDSTTAIKPGCPLGTTTAFPIYAQDRDNGSGDSSRLKIHVSWKAYSSDGPLRKSGSGYATFVSGNKFVVNFNLNGWPTDAYSFDFTVTSTDIYGGTTTITISGAPLSANQC